MTQLGLQPSGRYRPITKTLDLEDARLVLAAGRACSTADELMEAAVPVLPHAGRGRRRDIIRLVLRHVLGVDEGALPTSPPADLVADDTVPLSVSTAVFGLLYCSNTPLLREAVQDIYLPLIDDDLRRGETISVETWYRWLPAKLEDCSDGTLRKTRETQVMMLRRFGYIEGQRDHRPVARQPHPGVFAAAVALDYGSRGWSTRGLEYVLGASGPRCLTMVTRDYAGYCLSWADDLGVLARQKVGDHVDVAIAAGDPLSRVCEVMRGGL